MLEDREMSRITRAKPSASTRTAAMRPARSWTADTPARRPGQAGQRTGRRPDGMPGKPDAQGRSD